MMRHRYSKSRNPMRLELPDDTINELQIRSIKRLVALTKRAHYTNIQVRIDGAYRTFEADWLKHLKLPDGD